jgi:hypothetical protein
MNQANLDLAYQDFMRQQNYPLQQLQILQQGLGQTNLGAQQTSPYFQNTGASVLGGALAGSQLGPLLGFTGPYGAIAGGLLGLLR